MMRLIIHILLYYIYITIIYLYIITIIMKFICILLYSLLKKNHGEYDMPDPTPSYNYASAAHQIRAQHNIII